LTTCFLKNISGEIKNILNKEFQIDEVYQLPDNLRVDWASSDTVLSEIVGNVLSVGNGNSYFSTVNEMINYLKENVPIDTNVISQPPFAEPTYRTKRAAIASVVEVAAGATENLDFQLTADRYVTGGDVCVKNAVLGDHITACIYDKDSVIPEAYRAALCEAWPVVATYVEKAFLLIQGEHSTMTMDTYPLNAKVTAGLYMRITYHAVNSGETRQAITNYHFTKRLL